MLVFSVNTNVNIFVTLLVWGSCYFHLLALKIQLNAIYNGYLNPRSQNSVYISHVTSDCNTLICMTQILDKLTTHKKIQILLWWIIKLTWSVRLRRKPEPYGCWLIWYYTPTPTVHWPVLWLSGPGTIKTNPTVGWCYGCLSPIQHVEKEGIWASAQNEGMGWGQSWAESHGSWQTAPLANRLNRSHNWGSERHHVMQRVSRGFWKSPPNLL